MDATAKTGRKLEKAFEDHLNALREEQRLLLSLIVSAGYTHILPPKFRRNV